MIGEVLLVKSYDTKTRRLVVALKEILIKKYLLFLTKVKKQPR